MELHKTDIERILVDNYKKAINKLILLDYDGTLVKYENIPSDAKPSFRLMDILSRLNNSAQIIIVTGRKYQEIDTFMGNLQIDIIAEHGAMIRKKGRWERLIFDNGLWKREIINLFERYNMLCQNAYLEEKIFSLAWHYRNAEPKKGIKYSRELKNVLREKMSVEDFKILDGNKVIEVMSREISKGHAIKKIVEQKNYGYILSIGDDITDEEMFEYLLNNDHALTVKVGNGDTKAKFRLDKVEEVIEILEQLSFKN